MVLLLDGNLGQVMEATKKEELFLTLIFDLQKKCPLSSRGPGYL